MDQFRIKTSSNMPVIGSSKPLQGASKVQWIQLEKTSREDLLKLREKNEKLLQNASLLTKLPDKGAKIQDNLKKINTLLETGSISDRVKDLHLDENKNKHNVKLEQVAAANEEAKNLARSSILLQARRRTDTDSQDEVKVKMLSTEETIRLQNEEQQRMKENHLRRQMEDVKANLKGQSLADDLSLTMGRLRLDPETRPERPQDDESEDEESDESAYDGYEEDEGFEDDDAEYADTRVVTGN